MTKTIATTVAALMLASLSFGAVVAPASAAPMMSSSHSMHSMPMMSMHHPLHWHMHQKCHTYMRHHHMVKVCTWVKN